MITAEPHTLTGAYALHALDAHEREAFELHLADCEACGLEVAEFAATAARLGLATSAPPRPAVLEEVLRRITVVRQEQTGHAAPALPPGRALRRGRRWSHWATAACLAVTAVLGGTAWWQYDRAEDARDQARRAEQSAETSAAVLAAPDAKARTSALVGGARGTVVVSARLDKAVFVASGLAEPPSGKVYQLWFDDDGRMRPAGLMDPHRSSQTVSLTGAVDGASGMGITVEPTGGSDEPSSDPVAMLRLPA
ncbi:anti-sigma factor [Streptomyces sp. NBC_01231]|nr:anti-sigma factor [Streptomyces sp. NBC_01231]